MIAGGVSSRRGCEGRDDGWDDELDARGAGLAWHVTQTMDWRTVALVQMNMITDRRADQRPAVDAQIQGN